MPELPDMSALLDVIIGPRFREDTRSVLLRRADSENDPALARRLRDVAEGRRPLRTLLADQAFIASTGLDRVQEFPGTSSADVSPDERDAIRRRVGSIAAERPLPTIAELAAFAADATARAERSRRILEEERLTGRGGRTGETGEPSSGR